MSVNYFFQSQKNALLNCESLKVKCNNRLSINKIQKSDASSFQCLEQPLIRLFSTLVFNFELSFDMKWEW